MLVQLKCFYSSLSIDMIGQWSQLFAFLILQVVLTKLSKSLDKDSVRVDGVGPASIVEVSFQEISITGNDSVCLVSCQ